MKRGLERISRTSRPPRQVDRVIGLDASGPAREHDDAIAHSDRFLEVVRDEDDGLAAELAPNAKHVGLDEVPRLHVEGAERLVHQHEPGLVHHRGADRGALALAAGDLMRIAVAEGADAHPVEPPLCAAARLGAVDAAIAPAQRKPHVVAKGLPRQEGVGLEHEAHVAAHAGHGRAADANASGRGPFESRHHLEQGRLAAAGRTDDGNEPARLDVERDVLHRERRVGRRLRTAVAQRYAVDRQEGDVAARAARGVSHGHGILVEASRYGAPVRRAPYPGTQQ